MSPTSPPQESRLSFVTAPAAVHDRMIAVGFIVAIAAAFAGIYAYALAPLPRVDGFIPAVQAVICVTDFITAVLLFAHYASERSRAFLWLASGYLFSAVVVAAQTLTFPGAFTATGLLGAGPQTAAWLYVPWHAALPAAATVYALLKGRPSDDSPQNAVARTIRRAALGSALLAVAVVAAVILASDSLPPLVIDEDTFAAAASVATVLPFVLSVAALVMLGSRRSSILDEWLRVAMSASIAETGIIVFVGASRYTVAFYSSRLFALVVSSAVLVALLINMTRLYVRLANAVKALERERASRLMNLDVVVGSIGHEIKQPLTVIGTCGATVENLLRKPTVPIDDVRLNVTDMMKAALRITETIDSLRGLFRDPQQLQQPVDINELVMESIDSLGAEAAARAIQVRRRLAPNLPRVIGHKGQLREVIVNIAQNAMEALAPMTHRPRVLHLETGYDRGNVVVIVQDNGPGIEPDRLPGLFTAAVSTKASGMGLGLSICQMIVERHNGRLAVSSELGKGARFEIALPAAPAS